MFFRNLAPELIPILIFSAILLAMLAWEFLKVISYILTYRSKKPKPKPKYRKRK